MFVKKAVVKFTKKVMVTVLVVSYYRVDVRRRWRSDDREKGETEGLLLQWKWKA